MPKKYGYIVKMEKDGEIKEFGFFRRISDKDLGHIAQFWENSFRQLFEKSKQGYIAKDLKAGFLKENGE